MRVLLGHVGAVEPRVQEHHAHPFRLQLLRQELAWTEVRVKLAWMWGMARYMCEFVRARGYINTLFETNGKMEPYRFSSSYYILDFSLTPHVAGGARHVVPVVAALVGVLDCAPLHRARLRGHDDGLQGAGGGNGIHEDGESGER